MSHYQAPIKDMLFLLEHVLDFQHEDIDVDMVNAILDEAGKLAGDVLAPINRSGDQSGAKLNDSDVTTAPSFKEAYQQYCEGGWNSVPFDPEYGGQGLPWVLAFPIQEMWQGANMSFGLCPLLNQGAVEAILSHGSEDQKQTYLPKLISGEWTGTMNLTEPQAGSDLGLLRAKAEPAGNDIYKIAGQKIFITYGEHDLTDNIIHLVLARLPDAPDDVRGISLFVVPKFLEDGTRNHVRCIGLEHKLGIHASPTCTMEFDGAIGYLIGQPHMGLKYMFTMMNNARLSVGLQGVAIAEGSYQHALAYAQDRVQGKFFETGERVSIDQHGDVRRMLLTMRSQIEAGRALCYRAAQMLDSHDPAVDIMTPLVKSWCTDMACEVTSIGVQIHGGMGFVEETGAAQFYRDARILPIYEGTNGIQAADLVFRKVLRDEGKGALAFIETLKPHVDAAFIQMLEDVTRQILTWGGDNKLDLAAAAATPYLKGFAMIAAGALMAQSKAALPNIDDPDFAKDKEKTIQFYQTNILPLALAHLDIAKTGSQSV